ncbi:hypothetical protein EYF80_030430 [Liparis tanakae]|uniref:Uncharacterized protein n=1 Tax=Liparis tanakae TaxID=230148 RepID=A0A4Z2H0E6_9TELE|nr:hypothetical protein EYF80_030430 [Liparis tanakae]
MKGTRSGVREKEGLSGKQSWRDRRGERESERAREDSCRDSRWLSSGTQRQTPFSNPIVSAGRRPAPLCNPVSRCLVVDKCLTLQSERKG